MQLERRVVTIPHRVVLGHVRALQSTHVRALQSTQRVISAPFPQNTQNTQPEYSDLNSHYVNREVLLLTLLIVTTTIYIWFNGLCEYFFEYFFQNDEYFADP